MEKERRVSLIFDIDGVLLDVRDSYYRTVQEAVKMLLGVEVSLQEVLSFKRVKGFNDDWDVAAAIYGFYKYRGKEEISRFVRLIGDGGVKKAFEICGIGEEEVSSVRRLCEEIYGGVDACRFVFGFEPTRWLKSGLYNNERVLFDLSAILGKVSVGIVTGRNEKESVLALRTLGVEGRVDMTRVVHTDRGVKKPDPRALEILFEHMPTDVAVYFGDSMDDLSLAQNYCAEVGKVKLFFCGIYDSEEKKEAFVVEGADFVAPSTRAALSIVAHSGKLGDLSKLLLYSD